MRNMLTLIILSLTLIGCGQSTNPIATSTRATLTVQTNQSSVITVKFPDGYSTGNIGITRLVVQVPTDQTLQVTVTRMDTGDNRTRSLSITQDTSIEVDF